MAEMFSGRARAARPALVDGEVGLVWVQRGQPQMVFGFTIADRTVVRIELIADAKRIGELDLTVLDA